jgi:hypothetical protein
MQLTHNVRRSVGLRVGNKSTTLEDMSRNNNNMRRVWQENDVSIIDTLTHPNVGAKVGDNVGAKVGDNVGSGLDVQ